MFVVVWKLYTVLKQIENVNNVKAAGITCVAAGYGVSGLKGNFI